MNHHDDFAPLFAALEQRHAAAELDVLGALSADPRRTALFEAAGGTAAMFRQADHRAIYAGIDLARDRTPTEAIVAARLLLASAFLWDPAAPAWTRGPAWSDASLVSLFDSVPPSDVAVRHYGSQLVTLNRRLTESVATHDRLVDLLTGRVELSASRNRSRSATTVTAPRVRLVLPNHLHQPRKGAA